jgi:hypothetical protein
MAQEASGTTTKSCPSKFRFEDAITLLLPAGAMASATTFTKHRQECLCHPGVDRPRSTQKDLDDRGVVVIG